MKILKTFVVTLIALLLTGCYTQLQYSQKMKKVTDKEKKAASVYSDSENQQVPEDSRVQYEEYTEEAAYADQNYNEDEYVPVYYKDYQYAEKYSDCLCNPYTYNEYNFYGPDYGYYPYRSFPSYITLSDFYFYRWHPRFYSYHRYFGHPRFGFSISWGSPYFAHSFYYNSFYDPFFDPYWYGYHRPFGYNYHYYYGSYGYGYGYHGKTRKIDSNRRYGPRSIGTNRVVNNGSRSRDARVSGRNATVNNSPRTRTRSVGTMRTRTSSKRSDGTRVNRTRSRSDNNGGSGTSRVRSRSRDNNIQSNRSRDRVYIDRTDRNSEPVIIDRETYERMRRTRTLNQSANASRSLRDRSNDVRSRTLQRAPTVDLNRINRERSRPTFFQRMKSFFENNTGRIINDSRTRSNPHIRTRSSSSTGRSTVIGRRSSSSNNRGSVSRSKSSSSNNSRSRGGSSRSRSGGRDGGGSSGSDRSRGN